MSACPSCNSLYSHAPGCRATRPGGPAFGEELTRVFARAIDAACRLDTNPQPVRPEFLEATVKSGFLSEADASAYAETRRKMFVPILPPRTPWISQSLLDSCTEDAEPYGPGGPVCTCWASDEGDPTPDDHAQMCHADVHSSPVYIPSMDLAKPLPDGYWWCEECSASREKGHSCYERKSW